MYVLIVKCTNKTKKDPAIPMSVWDGV